MSVPQGISSGNISNRPIDEPPGDTPPKSGRFNGRPANLQRAPTSLFPSSSRAPKPQHMITMRSVRAGISSQPRFDASEGDVSYGEVQNSGLAKVKTWVGDLLPEKLTVTPPATRKATQVIKGFIRTCFLDRSPKSAFKQLFKAKEQIPKQSLTDVAREVGKKVTNSTQTRVAFALLNDDNRRASVRDEVDRQYPMLTESCREILTDTITDAAKGTLPTAESIRGVLPEKPLGEGAFSEVYKVRIGDEDCVVKVPKNKHNSPAFQHETTIRCHLAMSGDHPNVVGLKNIDASDELITIEPYVNGGDASKLAEKLVDMQLLRDLEIPSHEALNIGRLVVADAVKGMTFIHANRISHNDIKPDNLLIDRETGTVKWSDFGTCRYFGDSERGLGTREYMAPEVSKKGEAPENGKNDIYSLGLTMGVFFAGHTPFPKEDFKAVWDVGTAREDVDADNIDFFGPGIDEQLNDVTQGLYRRMRSRRPEDRPSLEELKNDPFLQMSDDEKTQARQNLIRLMAPTVAPTDGTEGTST